MYQKHINNLTTKYWNRAMVGPFAHFYLLFCKWLSIYFESKNNSIQHTPRPHGSLQFQYVFFYKLSPGYTYILDPKVASSFLFRIVWKGKIIQLLYGVCFNDFSKALDTVNHITILFKLKSFEFSYPVISLIGSDLGNGS